MSGGNNKNKAQSLSKSDASEELDIDELSRGAEGYIDEKEKKQSLVKTSKKKDYKKTLVIMMFIAAILLCAKVLLPASLSKAQLTADLGAIISAAQQSVEKYFLEKDQLPSQIPDRNLRMFVRYEVINARSNPPEYILRTQHKDVVMEVNSLKSEG